MKKFIKKSCYFLSFLFFNALLTHDLLIVGPTGFCDGTGRIAYALIDQLSDVLDVAYYRSFRNDAYAEYTLFDDPYKVQKKIKISDSLMDSSVFLYTNSLPELLKDESYKKVPATTMRLIYSAFESTAIPAECVEIFNKYFDKIIVPDPFLIDAYKNSGVKIPVIAAPMGLYLEKFLQLPLKTNTQKKPFVFSCVGTRYARKNIKKLIQAFAAVYGNNKDVVLKLQVKSDTLDLNLQEGLGEYLERFTEEELEHFVEKSMEEEESLEDLIEELAVDNIHLLTNVMSEEEYINFLGASDCYVLLSKGEGFSNTPREAMAAGIPIIISNNTAHTTIANAGYGIAINCPYEVDAWYEAFWTSRKAGKQFDCDQKDIETALKEMVNNYDFYLQQTEKAREWVKQYTWGSLKDSLVKLYSIKK